MNNSYYSQFATGKVVRQLSQHKNRVRTQRMLCCNDPISFYALANNIILLYSKPSNKLNAAIFRANYYITAKCIAIGSNSNKKPNKDAHGSPYMVTITCSSAHFVSILMITPYSSILDTKYTYSLLLSYSFCGTDWQDAIDNCKKRCPTGEDTECP